MVREAVEGMYLWLFVLDVTVQAQLIVANAEALGITTKMARWFFVKRVA